MKKIISILFLFSVFFSVVVNAENSTGDAKTKLITEGDYSLKQLVVPPSYFNSLPLNRKYFAYYISKAIDSGRDIVWRQNSPEGLAIRELLEEIYEHKSLLSPSQKGFLEEYLFKLYGNHSNYDYYNAQKFVLEGIKFNDLLTVVQKIDLILSKKDSTRNPNALVNELQRLQRDIFDPRLRQKMKTKKIGKNAAQFYVGIESKKDIEKLEKLDLKTVSEQNSKNNPFLLTYPTLNEKGQLVMELARIGGRFDAELRMVDHYLEKAAEYATDAELQIINAHRKTLQTGDYRDGLVADRLWVQNKGGEFDFILGFIENYKDPLGKRASWEGFLVLKKQDPETLNRIEAIRSNAHYFEDRMPVKEEYKKQGKFTPPQAEAAYIVYSGGDNGERPFAGVNLPNDDAIREELGSKSYGAYNVMNSLSGETLDKSDLSSLKKYYLPQYHEALDRVNFQLLHDLQVEFHEVLGHGSGRNSDGVRETDLGKYYNPLEEGRAEVASLYHMTDPKLREMGVLPRDMSDQAWKEFVELSIVSFFSNQLASYAKLGESVLEIRQAHQWARQLMLNWMIERQAIEVVFSESGIPQILVKDIGSARAALGVLWYEIQDIKSRSESPELKEKAAGELFHHWGKYSDKNREWRKKIESLNKELSIPKERPIFMNPKFKLVEGKESGQVENIVLEYASAKRAGLGLLAERQREMTQEYKKDCQKVLLKK